MLQIGFDLLLDTLQLGGPMYKNFGNT